MVGNAQGDIDVVNSGDLRFGRKRASDWAVFVPSIISCNFLYSWLEARHSILLAYMISMFAVSPNSLLCACAKNLAWGRIPKSKIPVRTSYFKTANEHKELVCISPTLSPSIQAPAPTLRPSRLFQ